MTTAPAELRPRHGLLAAYWIGSVLVIALGAGREIAALMAETPSPEFGWRLLSLRGEGNLVSWFSGSILFVTAILLFLQHRAVRATGGRDARAWLILAIGFVGLSLDEVGQIHELLVRPLRDGLQLTGYLYLGWVVVAIPLVIAILVAFVPFLWRLPRRTAILFLIAGAAYVAMTVGMDLIGGNEAYLLGFSSNLYVIVATFEEAMELVTISFFATVLMGHMSREGVGVAISFP